jgi:cytochrome P450
MSDQELGSPAFLADPYPFYARWREESPVWWSDRLDAYMIARYDDVRAMLKEPKVFGQSRRYEGAMIDAFGRDTMVILEPPRHGEVRNPTADYFRPRQLEAALGVAVNSNARRIVAGLPDRFELNSDLSEPLVMDSMALLFGIEDTQLLRDLYAPLITYLKRSRALDAGESTRQAGKDAGRLLVEFLAQLGDARRRRPGSDLISHLLALGMAEEEVQTVCALTLIGGVDTTVRGLANMLYGAIVTPGQQELLRARPELAENAFDEALRWISPLQLKGREVRKPVVVQGIALEPGRAVLGLLGSANRDPARYPMPDEFQADRKVGDHLAFGFGIHYCVGAPLARVEADAMLRALLERFQQLEIEGRAGLKFEGPVYRSPLSLPISGQAS